jgi:hypothetical protein
MMGLGAWTAEPTSSDVVCMECGAQYGGSRRDARLIGGWETFSASSQWAIDHGPMMCRDCVAALLDSVLEAIKAVPAEFWFEEDDDEDR